MSSQCTKERFLRDVAAHEIIVIRDDGVNRHIRFKRPETSSMYFDLITWPGHLCYTGDMGTYVFQRTEDMFGFFRKRGLDCIDCGYWAEKIVAADRTGVSKFSHEKFQSMVRSRVADDEENNKPDDDAQAIAKHAAAYAELRAAVKDEVENADDNSTRCYDAANDFRHDGEAWQEFHGKDAEFEFTDVWDDFDFATKQYTFRFLWCCYALAWAISQYDAAKQGKAGGATA